jgi:hypothetical protein
MGRAEEAQVRSPGLYGANSHPPYQEPGVVVSLHYGYSAAAQCEQGLGRP